MLSIPIRDPESGAEFQIDALSSGEKGLILTFLLIAQSVEDYGIVLLDEPELHLNPAVCRDLLQFFVDEYAEKRNIQGIICSHSAEILAGTFDRPSCGLYHLRDGKILAKVRQQDREEIRDVLRRLGSSQSEALLYRGTVSVEGIHDVEILEAGFGDLFRKYQLKQRGGRTQIEADIRALQAAESKGTEIGNHYFIFDLDRKPTSLENSTHVRLLQINRYCLENFLLDIEILTDLSKDKQYSKNPKKTTTDMREVMKRLAMSQLNEHIARLTFKSMGLEDIKFSMGAVREPSAEKIANSLLSQITEMTKKLSELTNADFKSKFICIFNKKYTEEHPQWGEGWQNLCNGKQLLEDLRKEGHFEGDILKLKKAIITKMQHKETDDYKELHGMLESIIVG